MKNLDYFTIYDKVSFKDFKSCTQNLLDSIPNSATISQAIKIFIDKYNKNKYFYDRALSLTIERNFKKIFIPKEIKLFYMLMMLRYRYPKFFPAPSLCVLMSHALRGQMRQIPEARISVKSIELLPIALLVAHEAKEIYIENVDDAVSHAVKNYLNENSFSSEEFFQQSVFKEREAGIQKFYFSPSSSSQGIQNFLKYQILNKQKWFFRQTKVPKENCVALSQFPLPHTSLDKSIFAKLQNYGASIVFTSLNFLASEEFKPLRQDLIERNLLDTVAQLPLPKREGNRNFPAILILNKEKSDTVSMLDLNTFNQECVSQVYLDLDSDGIIDDTEMFRFNDGYLQEIYGNIINREPFPWAKTGKLYQSYQEIYSKKTSADVHLSEILEESSLKLSPFMYITKKRHSRPSFENIVELCTVAEVIRCQEIRKPFKESFTLTKDDNNIYKEINLKDIDALTNFLLLDDASLTEMNLDKAKQMRFQVRNNDILLAHKGSKATIGRVGFVDMSFNAKLSSEDGFINLSAVPGTSLLIVRPDPDLVDPVWLFHYLQKKNVQELIQSKATGASLLSINLKAVRNLAIPSRSDKEISQIHAYHEKLAYHFKEIVMHKRSIEALKQQAEF